MHRKASLTCQSKKCFLVIRKNIVIELDKITKYCDQYFEWYCFIEHKNDYVPDTNEIEGCHYHIVGDFKKKGVPFKQRLNEIVKFFEFDNAFGIEIDTYENDILSVQYLTHQNYPSKTQHKGTEIISNLSKEELSTYLNSSCGHIIDIDFIEFTCLRSHNLREIIRAVGFGNYCKYRNIILDIYRDIKEERQYNTNCIDVLN